ncbi:ZIP zinc/iron transport family protein [Aspergillus niger]|uniref:ZIP zinc/iron transport family protein n=1 Tax=Aspergillus niger TaxID=5061 RepID=A0A505IJR8_ASPNG|nr:ZIP zinc/iron transport family protein [Aspergillus niger]
MRKPRRRNPLNVPYIHSRITLGRQLRLEKIAPRDRCTPASSISRRVLRVLDKSLSTVGLILPPHSVIQFPRVSKGIYFTIEMADTTEPTNTSGELPNPAPESTELPSVETTQPTTTDNSLPPIDTSLPPIDSTMPAMDDHLPNLDHTLPPIDATIPSLPPIDTSLPPLDTTLPAADGHLPGGEPDFSFPDSKSLSNEGHASEPTHSGPGTSFDFTEQSVQSSTPAPTYQSPSHSPSMNAPSMQPMDHHAVSGQSSQIPQAPIGSPMPSNMPPMPSVGQYMTGYPTNVGQMGMNANAQMRYQLPGDPNKLLSGGRHKKEVKRRTKTGCLTCRKRRIKCDEGHPVCRNCVKSKRECLGYDPVFKQQPTPSAIQPAPNPHPSLVVNPQDPSTSYPAAPPGYMPAASQPFAPSESPAPPSERYDYGTAIDPSLDVNNSNNMASIQHAVEGGLQPTVNPAMTSTSATPSEPTNVRLKQVQISDLLALRGIPPPPPHPITSLPPNRLEEIQAVFLATYAPAIDKFFETRWFQEKALTHLLANAQLMAEYSALIDAFNDPNLGDPNVLARLESFEASVVWSSMTLCRHVMNVSTGTQPEYDLLAAAKRLDVIESMITGEHLDSNPLAQFPTREPAANPPLLPDQLTQRSLDFWSSIGHFLTLHDNEASSAKEIDDTLARCRTLLDTFENRDVIYSIAIARHLGQRWADFPRSFPQPITTNEKDAGAKLYVAQKFLEQEAGGKGTTQVIKRICGMVVRSWIVSRE